VRHRYAIYLFVLGAIWGSSYLFIKIGVRDLSPAALIEIRLACAVPLLVVFAVRRYGVHALGAAWREGVVLGIVNAAIPFTLIAWGERYVDSGVAAVANASVPIFVAVLAFWFVPSERSTGFRLVGVGVGLAGVAILAGVHPAGGWKGAMGTGAIIVASISYAVANLYAGRRMRAGGPVLAANSMVVAFLVLLPLALVTAPSSAPGWKSLLSAVALGVLGTALAQVLSYRMIGIWGSSRSVLVAYMLPAFALFYGAVFLSEPLTWQKLCGLGLILVGVGLGSGALRLVRRTPVAEVP
jgi:drug/metabolite transporter (DMT)-like permease